MKTGSGEIHWSLQLSPEPVKSSPCVDVTSGIMWVGSHDHHLYAVDVEVNLEIVFLYTLDNCVSPPLLSCAMSTNTIVWCSVISISAQVGRVVRKVLVDGGSCFSSPCIDSQRNLVYIATLRGTVSAVDKVKKTLPCFVFRE